MRWLTTLFQCAIYHQNSFHVNGVKKLTDFNFLLQLLWNYHEAFWKAKCLPAQTAVWWTPARRYYAVWRKNTGTLSMSSAVTDAAAVSNSSFRVVQSCQQILHGVIEDFRQSAENICNLLASGYFLGNGLIHWIKTGNAGKRLARSLFPKGDLRALLTRRSKTVSQMIVTRKLQIHLQFLQSSCMLTHGPQVWCS